MDYSKNKAHYTFNVGAHGRIFKRGPKLCTCSEERGKMVLANFNGGGVGFGFGVGCGFGVGWGFGGVPLNIFGLGAGGGCGVGLGLGWGFGAAYGSRYYSPGLTFQGVEFESKSSEGKDSKNLSKNN